MFFALAVAAMVQTGVVESVIVHGNHTTPTADVLAIAGDLAGREATDALFAEVTARLVQSGRFAGVDVRRRLLSLDDDSRVLVVIVVDEHEGISDEDLTPGPLKRFRAGGMWLPVLDYQEGYGFTYGARVSFVDRLGPRSRISVPLTWGGGRQAGLEVERAFAGGRLSRVVGGAEVTRREHPFYEVGDTRRGIWGRVETAPRAWLRGGAGARRARVSFGDVDDTLVTSGVDVTLDTRRDPALPRNAVYASAGIERLAFDARSLADVGGATGPRAAGRLSIDVRGYLGLVGQAVLAVRAQSVTASRRLPEYEQQMLGGVASLRGHDVGSQVGDNLAAVSVEVLAPLTSPLTLAHAGLKVFVDRGAVYAAGERLADRRLEWGYGAGWFLNATVFSLGIDLGWREARSTPNAHVQLGVRLTR
ncbi:MAG: BamA/TamA family outer membrane protein [Acidobacteria bacterium]|nr:BamA/TamA family outer membrane protein [Acidobacteriota bacterium]